MNDEWTETTLGECFTLVTDKVAPATLDPTTPYVGLEHLAERFPRVARSGSTVDVSSLVSTFRTGDTLFGRLRPYLRKVAYADFDGVCSPEILVLRANMALVQPEYLHLLASSDEAIEYAVSVSAGSRMPRTSATDLASLPISLPPLPVQRRLVDVMAHLDAHIESMGTERDTLDRVIRLVPDQIADEQTREPLGRRIRARGGKRMPKGVKFSETETRHPYLRVVDMADGTFLPDALEYVPEDVWPVIRRYVVARGDLVVSIVGTIGRVAVVPAWADGANLTENAAIIDVLGSDLDPEWLAHWLRGPTGQTEIERVTVGTSQGKLALSRIPLIEVPRCSMSVQRAVADACTGGQHVLRSLSAEIAGLRSWRDQLLNRLLAGQVTINGELDELVGSVG